MINKIIKFSDIRNFIELLLILVIFFMTMEILLKKFDIKLLY